MKRYRTAVEAYDALMRGEATWEEVDAVANAVIARWVERTGRLPGPLFAPQTSEATKE